MKRLILAALAALSAFPAAADDKPDLVTVLTAPEPQTQLMSMVLTMQSIKQGAAAHVLLCGPAGDLALKDAPASATAPQKPKGMSPQGLMQKIMEQGATVEVCAIYLPNKGVDPFLNFVGSTVGIGDRYDALFVGGEQRKFTHDLVGQRARLSAPRACGQENAAGLLDRLDLIRVQVLRIPDEHQPNVPETMHQLGWHCNVRAVAWWVKQGWAGAIDRIEHTTNDLMDLRKRAVKFLHQGQLNMQLVADSPVFADRAALEPVDVGQVKQAFVDKELPDKPVYRCPLCVISRQAKGLQNDTGGRCCQVLDGDGIVKIMPQELATDSLVECSG